MRIISVVGARPNFIKIAPFVKAIKKYNIENNNIIDHILVHTGQHYDSRMSEAFFKELEIPEPDINLGVGSGSHAEQVGNTMIEFEKVVKEYNPDWVVVVGDVNATLACSITAKKEWVKCCHIEAGLRSGDIKMPEEINRLVTDRISDLLLTPDKISVNNLLKEGTPENKIEFVGNIMIDTLELKRDEAKNLKVSKIIEDNIIKENSEKLIDFDGKNFGLITMHRPSNVDDKLVFTSLTDWIVNEAVKKIILIWPIHPRTINRAKEFGIWNKLIDCNNLILTHPLSYLEMLKLNMESKLMLTDSGGLQEECCVLGTPFLTLRWNTERPVTLIEHGGAGYLVGNSIESIRRDFNKIISEQRTPNIPELWDGKTAERCLNAILKFKQ